MARARNIKPGFFDNEELGTMSFGAQLLFIGLWTLADRDGRLEDRPTRIKGKLFPYRDDTNIDSWLDELANSKEQFIIRYLVNGLGYIQVVKFKKHQSPHVKEQPSTIPAPSQHQISPVLGGCNAQLKSLLAPPESVILNPDCLNVESLNAESGVPPPSPDSVRANLQLVRSFTSKQKRSGEDWFEETYSRHPKKGDRGLAQQYLSQSVLSEGFDSDEFDRVHKLWVDHWNATGSQFGPNLAKWLLDQGWRYEPPAKQSREVPAVQGFKRPQDAVWDRV